MNKLSLRSEKIGIGEVFLDSNYNSCYQCYKCSSGCPVNEWMDKKPAQLMLLLQLGRVDEVLNSKSIWFCASCWSCEVRCPNGINITEIIDQLRIAAQKGKYSVAEKNILLFHRLFLLMIKYFGRVPESALMAVYNFMTRKPFRDLSLGFFLFKKGRLSLFPRFVNVRRIRKIFAVR